MFSVPHSLCCSGNPNRDIWKRSAWIISEEENLPVQERAIYSALCGNAQQIIKSHICSTYEDVLWTLVRAMVGKLRKSFHLRLTVGAFHLSNITFAFSHISFPDVLVEEEIRETLPKSYAEMPQKYWDNLKDLRSILSAVRSSDSSQVREEMCTVYHRIQTYIMLEEWDVLYESASDLAHGSNDPHLLRFLSHLTIVLDRLGISSNGSDEMTETVQEAYIRFLMKTNRVQQVAWYTALLKSEEKQLALYAEFMEGVENDADRRFVLEMAFENKLRQEQLRVNVVEKIVSDNGNDDEGIKISAIDWLLLDPVMPEDAVVQTNALVRYLIACQKVEEARLALNKAMQLNKEDIENQDAVREHYALNTYLDAKDSFADWFKYFHQGMIDRSTSPAQRAQTL
jgi:hypothetical protein